MTGAEVAEAPRGAPEWNRGAGWRAVVLLALAASGPFEVFGLVSIPFVLLVVAMRPRPLAVLLPAGLAVWIEAAVVGRGMPESWEVERGWALLLGGGFAAATLGLSASPFLDRALLAVGGALLVAAGVFAGTAADWAILEAMVEARIQTSISAWQQVLGAMELAPATRQAVEDALYRGAELQVMLIPATLGLASLCALGAAWWLWCRFSGSGSRSLGPISAFRFNDEMVWLLIAGLALALPVFEGRLAWAGLNIAVFMGVLYGARGSGVLAVALAESSWAMRILFFLMAALFPPGAALTLVLVGLGDNWLDFRARMAARGDTK